MDLERFVGGRLFAVVGALVVIAGAGLGLKLAWDLGYFRLLNEAGRSAAMGGFGAALLVVGEIARRRWGRAAGEGLSAAGLGVLFATVYAMTARFGLLAWTPGLAALFGVASLGFAVSALGGLIVTPAVAVVGGFLAPLLLGEPTGSAGVLALYWLTLSALAHALTALRGPGFAPARSCAWWGSVAIGGAWAADAIAGGRAEWAFVYALGVWALTHGELWRSCARRAGAWPAHLLERSIGASVVTTLWFTVLGMGAAAVFGWASWTLPAALSVAHIALATTLVSPRGLLRTPKSPAEVLAVTLALAGGALAIVAGLLAFVGWFEPVVFSLAGLACVAGGARARAGWLTVYGLVTLAVGSLAALASIPLRDGAGVTLGAIEFTRWSAVVGVAGAAWLAAGFVRRGDKTVPVFPALALAHFGLALVSDDPDPRWLSAAWGALALVYALAGRVEPKLRLDVIGLSGLVISYLLWFPVYLAGGWGAGAIYGSGAWSVHEGVVAALAHGLAVLWAARWTLRAHTGSDAVKLLCWIACASVGATALVATSFDTARLAEMLTDDQTARRAAVSIWWGVYAIGLLVIGGWRRAAIVRYAGLALLGVATFKAVLFDLAAVAQGWRVASFLLLGLLLLGVATAYARWASREAARSRGSTAR